jgi:hypothetical protein
VASAREERQADARQFVSEGGVPLTSEQRAYFEPRFGHDFGDVRIHTDGAAMRSAARIDANAYTLGQHIAFAAGQFAPETVRGQRLIAHELSHVVQSRSETEPVVRRDKAGSSGGEEETYDIPEIHDPRISDSSTQEELRKIYWEHGYETAGVTFRRVSKNHWEANQVLHRRKIIITDELSHGSALGPIGPSGEEGPVGEGSPGPEKGDPKTGTEKGTGSKPGAETEGKAGGMSGGKAGGTATGKSTEGDRGSGGESSVLDDLAALAALVADPNSLYEAQKSGSKGKGSQLGSSGGFLSGWFAQVLTILMVFGGPIKKLFQKIGGFFRRQFRRLFPSRAPKGLLPPGGGGPKPPVFTDEEETIIKMMMNNGESREAAETLVLELRKIEPPGKGPANIPGKRDWRNLK